MPSLSEEEEWSHCADVWLRGLVSVQVMCQSDNQILRHCFRREEVIDQKRPEMVRAFILSISHSISLSLSLSFSVEEM